MLKSPTFKKGINLKTFAREGFWIAAGLGASVVALLVGTRLLTTLLTPIEYAKLALSMSLMTFAVQIGGTPISLTAVRFYFHWREEGNLSFFLRMVSYNLIIALGIIFAIGFIFIVIRHSNEGLLSIDFILILTFFTGFMLINRVAFGIEDATRQRRIRALFQVFFEISRFILAIGLLWFLSTYNAKIALSGFLIAALLVVTGHFLFLKSIFRSEFMAGRFTNQKIVLSDVISWHKFLLPLIISYGCIWLIMMTERWVLQHYGNLTDVGGYAAVYQLAFIPMTLISNFLLLLTTPIIYQIVGVTEKTVHSRHTLRINQYMAITLLAATSIVFVLLLYFHQHIGRIFLGEAFRSYSWMFPWLLLAGGCFASAQQILLKFSCELRTLSLALFWLSIAIIAVSAYIIGAKYWGLKGLFMAVVGTNVFLIVSALFVSKTNR